MVRYGQYKIYFKGQVLYIKVSYICTSTLSIAFSACCQTFAHICIGLAQQTNCIILRTNCICIYFFYSQYDSTMSRTPTKAELRNIDQLVGQIRSRQWALSPLPPDKLSKTKRRMLDNDRKTLHIMIDYLSNVVSQFDVIPPSAAHVLR